MAPWGAVSLSSPVETSSVCPPTPTVMASRTAPTARTSPGTVHVSLCWTLCKRFCVFLYEICLHLMVNTKSCTSPAYPRSSIKLFMYSMSAVCRNECQTDFCYTTKWCLKAHSNDYVHAIQRKIVNVLKFNAEIQILFTLFKLSTSWIIGVVIQIIPSSKYVTNNFKI